MHRDQLIIRRTVLRQVVVDDNASDQPDRSDERRSNNDRYDANEDEPDNE